VLKIIIILILLGNSLIGNEYLLPVDSDNRRNVNYLELTEIGEFGAFRKDTLELTLRDLLIIIITNLSILFLTEP